MPTVTLTTWNVLVMPNADSEKIRNQLTAAVVLSAFVQVNCRL